MSLTRKILKIFFISRLWLFFIAIFAFSIFPKQIGSGYIVADGFSLEGFIKALHNWDGGYYLEIVKHGYPSAAAGQLEAIWAFLPGYPILVKLFSLGINNDLFIVVVGVLLSNLLFLLSLLLLKSICSKLAKEQLVLPLSLLFCFYPGSIYFSFFYTESLFIFLALLAYRLILEKKWLWGALAIALLAITRKPGILMLFVFVFEFLKIIPASNRAKYFLKFASLILLQLLPFFSYLFYLQTLSGSFFTFLSIQSLWSSIPAFPFSGIYHLLLDPRFTNFLHVFFWSCFSMLTLFNWRKIPPSLMIYTTLYLYVLISSGELASMLRYLVVAFPVFLILAEVIYKKDLAFKLVLAVFASVQTLLLILFINGYGFAT